jgi:hypothetical protein
MAAIQPPEQHVPTIPALRSPTRLKPLKTLLELKAGNSTIDVYITIVPIKTANSVLK